MKMCGSRRNLGPKASSWVAPSGPLSGCPSARASSCRRCIACALAEYSRTTVVLDDQLVQSDDTRMDWFRALLVEKARKFQIIVFTCRPVDYVAQGAMVPPGTSTSRDTDAGFVRAIDLSRAIQKR